MSVLLPVVIGFSPSVILTLFLLGYVLILVLVPRKVRIELGTVFSRDHLPGSGTIIRTNQPKVQAVQ
ncbi:hypothetical protein ACFLWX_01350 [Chloroflexota bacterium]